MKRRINTTLQKLLLLIIIIIIYEISTNHIGNNEKISSIQKREIEITEEQQEANKSPFNIHFIDVDQGDAILIENEHQYALIDAGSNESKNKLISYLKQQPITSLEFVIGTHAHEDHIGGMDEVIKNFQIKHFYMPNVITTTKTFEDVLDALKEKKITFETPKIEEELKLGEAIIKIVWVGEDKEDLNNTSIIVKVIYKDTSYLLTGDATNTVEKEILEKDLESTVLKVAHHGSQYSSSAQFLKKVYPKIAIISVGKDNSYGHPKEIVLKKLERIGSKIYRTDESGTIILSSEGKEIKIYTEK